MLDAAPAHGVGALDEVAALTSAERRRIGQAMPVLANHMATFEAAMPAAVAHTKTAMEADVAGDLAPIDFAVEAKGTTTPYRAVGISGTAIAFTGRAALKPSWLGTITLRSRPAPITVLATIKTCVQHGPLYTITAQPFGLAASDRAVWLELVASAVRLAEPAVVRG